MFGLGYVVTGDLYGISERIKEIDENYFLYYSYVTHRYEVHNSNQRGNTLSLVLPYETLDERTLRHVRRTRSERSKALFEEIAKENAKVEKENMRALVKKQELQMEQAMHDYTSSKGGKNE